MTQESSSCSMQGRSELLDGHPQHGGASGIGQSEPIDERYGGPIIEREGSERVEHVRR
jgi:hypothetical protein